MGRSLSDDVALYRENACKQRRASGQDRCGACATCCKEARDRASTSYREGYEAGKAAGREGEVFRQWCAAPVLASSPLDPKALNIWEMADMLASLTASMRGLADALAEAERLAGHWRAVAERRRNEAWENAGDGDKLREQLRLLTKERDEWREEAMALRKASDPTSLR